MDRTIGVGIIGCGSVARWKYLPNLCRLPGTACRAFLGGQAEACRAEYGAPEAVVCASLEELLLRRDVEAVFVCTPNRTHAAISIAALQAGKHVLCEKPMATCEADALTMVQAAESAGKILSIGHQARFYPSAQHLRQEIQCGELGEIYVARASMLRRLGIPTWGQFTNLEAQGGGCLIDLGTHAVDLALWLMGTFDPAYCIGSCFQKRFDRPTAANRWGIWDAENFQVEDSAFGQVVMKNGALLRIDTSWALHVPQDREEEISLSGTLAGAEWSPAGYARNGIRAEQLFTEQVHLPAAEDDANRAQLADFMRAIRTGGTPLVTARESLAVSRILFGLYQSAREGKAVLF